MWVKRFAGSASRWLLVPAYNVPTMSRLLLFFAVFGLVAVPARAEISVRVGIVAYEDFESELAHYERFFGGLTAKDSEVSFQLAVGSYGEVLHWVDRQLVDLAILTPGVFASVISEDPAFATCQYLASVELPPAASPLAPEIRRVAGFHDSYRSVCVVANDSPIQSVEQLRRTGGEWSCPVFIRSSKVAFGTHRSFACFTRSRY